MKDVKVDMDGDLVKAYVIFNFHGKDLSLELDGHWARKTATSSSNPWPESSVRCPAAIDARCGRVER